jgi:hypothetical protein
MYICEQRFSLSACGARQMTEEWGELNINWHLVHSIRSFGLPMAGCKKPARYERLIFTAVFL